MGALLVVILLQVLSVPAASPAAQLKTIGHVRVSPLCTTMHGVFAPFLAVAENDRARFGFLSASLGKLRMWGSGPTATLAIGNIDWYAAQNYDELAKIDLLLKHSYEQTPIGKDPQLDAVRSRMQVIVDLDRAITDQYDARAVSFNYWRSIVAEVRRTGGPVNSKTAIAKSPLAWLLAQDVTERQRMIPVALTAAQQCGDK